jgi:hypothetical protein
MIFDKARMAKLSGLMTESSHKGIKDAMADQFGGGKEEGDAWLDGEVTTEGAHDEADDEGMMHKEQADEDEAKKPMEARGSHDDDADEEKAVREMIRTELRKAKVEMEEEKAVREAVRKEIRSVLRSRGVTLGGTGFGFKR